MDELFDASLSFHRRHLEALQADAEEQGSKGHSRAEILESIELETSITKAMTRRRTQRAERARAMRA